MGGIVHAARAVPGTGRGARTTKPPYTLALGAALFRERGWSVRLDDLTATARSVEDLIARLDADQFHPTLIVFPSTTPTLEADAAEMAKLKARYGAPVFGLGAFASTTPLESMERAPVVDGFFIGEPEDGLLALGALDSLSDLDTIPSLTFRRQGQIVPHRAHGTFTGFLDCTVSGVGPARSGRSPASGRQQIVRPGRNVEGLSVFMRLCVAPIHQGHKFRERSAKALVDEIERGIGSSVSPSSISGATRSRST